MIVDIKIKKLNYMGYNAKTQKFVVLNARGSIKVFEFLESIRKYLIDSTDGLLLESTDVEPFIAYCEGKGFTASRA